MRFTGMFAAMPPFCRAAAPLRAVLTLLAALVLLTGVLPQPAAANAKYAAIVVDGNTGAVLHASSADKRRYPASLTKIMTLYILFEELESGRLSLQTRIPISARAARQPASRLGLAAGDSIPLEDAILALVVKSANDIATAVAEHIAGSESAFARRMTQTAQRLGMRATRFQNASGLPNRSQYTTARDMALLGRLIRLDFPEHYSYFSVSRFTFRGTSHRGHNALVRDYDGADGIKTGYINASGFNLVSSVERDGRRLVAVVMGGRTAARRDNHSIDLLNRHLPQAVRAPVLHAALPEGPLPNPLRLAREAAAIRMATAQSAATQAMTPKSILPGVGTASASARVAAESVAQAGQASSAPLTNEMRRNSGAIFAEFIRRRGPVSQPPPVPLPPQRTESINLAALLPSLIPPLPQAPARAGEESAGGEESAIGSAETAAGGMQPGGSLESDGWSVQLGAHASPASARESLHQARARAPKALQQARAVVQSLALGNGRALYWSGFSGFENLNKADSACSDLRRQHIWCVATSSPLSNSPPYSP